MLAGCRDVTAPEARNMARSVEKRIGSGDLRGLSEIFMFMGTLGQVHGMPMAHNEALQIVRDGVPQAINGFIIEEILVAPGGIGKPFVRRSLVGWPNSEEFAVFALTDTHPGTLRRPPQPAYWRQEPHRSFTSLRLQIPGDTLGSWVPHSGTVDIGEAVIDRECGTKEPVPQTMHAAERVQCNFAVFEVAVRGELITLADHTNPLLRSFQRRHRLEIPRQRLPGIQFVTTCAKRPDEPDLEEFDCLDTIRFWRDSSQYAPALRIDLAKMQRSNGGIPGWFTRVEKWPDGKAHDYGQVRWKFYAPDGRLLKSGSRRADDESESARKVDEWLMYLNVQPDVRRLQAIVPARFIDQTASPYEVWVLEMELFEPS